MTSYFLLNGRRIRTLSGSFFGDHYQISTGGIQKEYDACSGLQTTKSMPIRHGTSERLPVEDLFLCARYDDLWERVAGTRLCQKLSLFALFQDSAVRKSSSGEGAFVELRWRLGLAEEAFQRPASAIVFSCCDKSYEALDEAPCFPDGTSVAQVDVLCPDHLQRCGFQKRSATRLCVLMFFEKPGTEFHCECLSCVWGHSAENVHMEPMATTEMASVASVDVVAADQEKRRTIIRRRARQHVLLPTRAERSTGERSEDHPAYITLRAGFSSPRE
ncbi:hypothetical protein HPB50_004938 [Hyalomma asiaticum]|uniref:Uncharacterized protein n=1 Tax=Hyalomma asiaticum TaxID=266040 RepID=A0ACB7TCG5_HYAAI|nr:hypothetical protein HPB50_004938 [Hyalomma asiaticum]